MHSTLQQLSQSLFDYQHGTGPGRDLVLEKVLDRVLENRCRGAVSAAIGPADAEKVIRRVRVTFINFAASISAADPGRFLHSCLHVELSKHLGVSEEKVHDSKSAFQLWASIANETSDAKSRLVHFCSLLGASKAETARALGLKPSDLQKTTGAGGKGSQVKDRN